MKKIKIRVYQLDNVLDIVEEKFGKYGIKVYFRENENVYFCINAEPWAMNEIMEFLIDFYQKCESSEKEYMKLFYEKCGLYEDEGFIEFID